jgi:hypothetical protein
MSVGECWYVKCPITRLIRRKAAPTEIFWFAGLFRYCDTHKSATNSIGLADRTL